MIGLSPTLDMNKLLEKNVVVNFNLNGYLDLNMIISKIQHIMKLSIIIIMKNLKLKVIMRNPSKKNQNLYLKKQKMETSMISFYRQNY